MISGKWIIQTCFQPIREQVIKVMIKEQGFGDKSKYPTKPYYISI